MENCHLCQRKVTFQYLNRTICNKCFMRNIEKRIKKYLGRRLFKKGDSVLVIGELENHLLKKAVKNLPLKIINKKRLPSDIKDFKKIVVGKSLSKLDEQFLTSLFKGKIESVESRFFNILAPLTEEEIIKYSKISQINYCLRERKNSGKDFLDKLKQFEEIKYNLYKNIKEISQLNG